MGEPRTRADSHPTPRRTLRKVTAPARTSWAAARYLPNGTDTDRYRRLLSERRKSGAKGHHLGAKLVERRANGRLLPPGSTPEAGGGVAGPMQPDHTAHSGRR